MFVAMGNSRIALTFRPLLQSVGEIGILPAGRKVNIPAQEE
jgi:hypothetical protein